MVFCRKEIVLLLLLLLLGTYADERHWTDEAIVEIQKRIQQYGEEEIRFNLLAVVRDPLKIWQQVGL
jgi:hypothetical protein